MTTILIQISDEQPIEVAIKISGAAECQRSGKSPAEFNGVASISGGVLCDSPLPPATVPAPEAIKL